MNAPIVAARRTRGMTTGLVAGMGAGAHPRISIAGNAFNKMDAAGNKLQVGGFDQGDQSRKGVGLYLDLVVIDWNDNVSKVFYPDWDPNEVTPPTCYSDNGTGPSAQAQAPQAPTCISCYWNTWGSDVSKMTGKDTKGCNDVKKVAVIIPEDPHNMTYEFRIPPASLKNLRAYVGWFGSQKHFADDRALEITDVITRVYFESQGILNFMPVGYLDGNSPDSARIDAIWDAEDAGQDATSSLVGKKDVALDPRQLLPSMLDRAGQPLLANPTTPVLPTLPAPIPAAPAHLPAPPAPTHSAAAPSPSSFGAVPPPTAPAQAATPPRPGRGGRRAGAGRPAVAAPTAAPAAPPPPQGFSPPPPPAAAPAPNAPPQPTPFQPTLAAPVNMPAGDPGPMPPFLQRPGAAPAAPPPPAGNGGNFGMVNPPAPNPQVSAALSAAFGSAPGAPR